MSARLKRVRINGIDWTIKKLRSKKPIDGDADGLCVYDDHEVQVRGGLAPLAEADTILHELFHAILHSQGREQGGDLEELYVRALATGLLGVIRDNPQLLKWLTTLLTPTTPKG